MPRQKQKNVIKKTTRLSRSSTKTIKKTKTVSSRISRAKKLEKVHEKFNGWKWTESYNSFLLGIVVVIIGVLFVASFIRQQSKIQETSSIATTAPSPTAVPSPTPGSTYKEGDKTYYLVKADDSLWNIAEQIYSDGYKWTDIAKANNLANPGTIFKGDKLLIPNAPEPSTLGQITRQQNPQSQPSDAITANSYTVQKGDSLWTIAVRAYADGYKWTDIAKANNLTNPDAIYSGNILTLPR